MISDPAYNKIKDTFDAARMSEGAFSIAIIMYQQNYIDLRAAGKSNADAEATLLTDVTIRSLQEQSVKAFRDHAKKEVRLERMKLGFLASLTNVLLGVIGNFVFVIICVGMYIAIQDTANSFLRSIGFPGASPAILEQAEPVDQTLEGPG